MVFTSGKITRHPRSFQQVRRGKALEIDSNSEVNADKQELTTQASQRDSQNPNIIAFTDSPLRFDLSGSFVYSLPYGT